MGWLFNVGYLIAAIGIALVVDATTEFGETGKGSDGFIHEQIEFVFGKGREILQCFVGVVVGVAGVAMLIGGIRETLSKHDLK